MRKALIALLSAAAFGALDRARPVAAQEQAQVQPNYRPGDFVQGTGLVLAAPFQIVFTPYEALVGWPVSNCQRTQQQTGHEWRTVTVCN